MHGLLQTGIVENPRQGIKFLIDFLEVAHHDPTSLKTVFATLRAQLPL